MMDDVEYRFQRMSEIEKRIASSQDYRLVSREFKPDDTIIELDGVEIGGNKIAVAAGPCTVENENQVMETAISIKKSGATLLRGGAFKPRTSVYSFQGLGEDGLKILAKAREETGLPIVTEIMSSDKVELVASYADILQIGCRNIQNYPLLTEAGKTNKPIVLKRGFNTTLQEFLLSAEYILAQGNTKVILCERGIRTFETMTRNTFDISAVPILKKLSHLPVMADPSHATGKRDLIMPMSRAAVAAGADSLMIEVHPTPERALSDGAQSLRLQEFHDMMEAVRPVARSIGRDL